MNEHLQSDVSAANGDRTSALCAALVGDYAAAESLLAHQTKDGYTAADLDLLARLAVHQGNIARAGSLWHAAVAADPTHVPSLRALKALDGRWQTNAVFRRLAVLTAWTVLGVAAVVGVCASGFELLHSSGPLRDEAIASGRSKPKSGSVRDAGMLASLSSLRGAVASVDSRSVRIMFREPLFAHRTDFRPGSLEVLRELGSKLRTIPKTWEILIEGRTDALLPRVDSPFRDNYALGLARAAAVAQFLVSDSGVSGTDLKVNAHGVAEGSLSQETTKGKPSDRTVVILIRPQT